MGKKMEKNLRDNKGITLITVLLIILAGMSISLSLTNNGIFNKAKNGRDAYEAAMANEDAMTGGIQSSVDELMESQY